MVAAPHLSRFFHTGHKRVGCHPDAQAKQQSNQHRQHRLPIFYLRAGDAIGDPQPEIIVRSEKEHPDEHGLQNEQPGQKASHERDAHLLVVLVNFPHEPVAGKRERQQTEDADEVPDIAHPVVVVALFRVRGRQIANPGIGAADVPTEHHVCNQAVNVHRPPGRIPCRGPGPRHIRPLGKHDRT